MKLTIDGYSNIINNKYFRWYKNIISNRLLNPVSPEIYTERHHIFPKCLGGNNDKNNIVILTAKEHYIVHLCLCKCINTFTSDYHKILCAFNAMNMKSKLTLNRHQSSKLYEYLRTEYSIQKSLYMKKLFEDLEFKEKMRTSIKISWYDGSRDKQLEYMKNNSPFKVREIHTKTMLTRKIRRSNIFETNNPMYNPEFIKKKVEKTSGKNHYLVKKYRYSYSNDNGLTWILFPNNSTVKEICKLNAWSVSSFNYILSGKIPKRGKMVNILIKREINEN